LNQDTRGKFEGFPSITLYDWMDSRTLWSVLQDIDLVITRWSASSLAETDIHNVRKVIIPLPWSSNNHQYHNAIWYKNNRGDILLEEADIRWISEVISRIIFPEKQQ
jgi:UDP-N-acetylglucosamine:LPS N-acetylglucosamine transferase